MTVVTDQNRCGECKGSGKRFYENTGWGHDYIGDCCYCRGRGWCDVHPARMNTTQVEWGYDLTCLDCYNNEDHPLHDLKEINEVEALLRAFA